MCFDKEWFEDEYGDPEQYERKMNANTIFLYMLQYMYNEYNAKCCSFVTNKFDKYLIPNENELLFLENFKNKRYTPELLFDDKTIVDTIINHPMAIWKTKQ